MPSFFAFLLLSAYCSGSLNSKNIFPNSSSNSLMDDSREVTKIDREDPPHISDLLGENSEEDFSAFEEIWG